MAAALRGIHEHLASGASEAPTVMIVDDDDDARDILGCVLEHAGYATLRVRNGKEALRMLDKVIPALILCDLRMPVMDGWTLDRRLRSDPQLKKIPVVVISAIAKLESARIGVHAEAWFQKPVHLGELLELVPKLTQRSAGAEPTGA